jgi:hypothetical protein
MIDERSDEWGYTARKHMDYIYHSWLNFLVKSFQRSMRSD